MGKIEREEVMCFMEIRKFRKKCVCKIVQRKIV